VVDGVASSIIRAAAADAGPDYKWVVFDGPVDSTWVESLNTGGLELWRRQRRQRAAMSQAAD
jgi:hypothetical protein